MDWTIGIRQLWRLVVGVWAAIVHGRRCDQRVLQWAIGQDVAVGTTKALVLPRHLCRVKVKGCIHVARLLDGRTCVLLKKRVGWKDNFEGTLCCDGPLSASELVMPPSGGTAYVTLAGHGPFEELYVRHQHDERTLDVYFDLN